MYAKVTVTPKFTSFILDISFSNDDVHYRHKDEDKKIRLYIIFTHRKKTLCFERNQVSLLLPKTIATVIETIGKSILTTDHS